MQGFEQTELYALAQAYVETSPLNRVTAAQAIHPGLVGLRLFDAPIWGVASAQDPLFVRMREPGIVGAHFWLPTDWAADAVSVLSFFMPFSEQVRRANAVDAVWPASEWLHGRIEGQAFINSFCVYVRDAIVAGGGSACVPAQDARFWTRNEVAAPEPGYTSNWSERHVAHISGLGTFGLSAGLITRKGLAGRFGSIITSLPLAPTQRPYQAHDAYCTKCGACARNCPAHAISVAQGKNHALCERFVSQTGTKYAPRYGCGKCQVSVPCEAGIPTRPAGA